MQREMVLFLGGLLLAGPLAAQDNPFALTGGSVKTAHIVYDVTSKNKEAQGTSYEIGVGADRMMMRMVTPFEAAGKKDTARFLVVTTKDSQYTYHSLGSAGAEGEVSPTLRAHLAREYASLNSAAKARFRQNAKLAAEAAGSRDADAFITLIGEKSGSETIAGHRCDVYRTRKSTACVMPNAPMVMLRWQDGNQGLNLIARKVTLNGPLPPALAALPKGVSWKKSGPTTPISSATSGRSRSRVIRKRFPRLHSLSSPFATLPARRRRPNCGRLVGAPTRWKPVRRNPTPPIDSRPETIV